MKKAEGAYHEAVQVREKEWKITTHMKQTLKRQFFVFWEVGYQNIPVMYFLAELGEQRSRSVKSKIYFSPHHAHPVPPTPKPKETELVSLLNVGMRCQGMWLYKRRGDMKVLSSYWLLELFSPEKVERKVSLDTHVSAFLIVFSKIFFLSSYLWDLCVCPLGSIHLCTACSSNDKVTIVLSHLCYFFPVQ